MESFKFGSIIILIRMQGKTLVDKAQQQIANITVRDLDRVNVLNIDSCEQMLRLLKMYGKSLELQPAVALHDQSKLICFGQL